MVDMAADKLLLPFGLVVIAVGATMVIWLHARPDWGGVNPVTGMLSDYGIGSLGGVFDTAMDMIGAGSAALLVVMRRRGLLRRGPELALMVTWCVCVIGVGTCTKDPTVGGQTIRGTLHLAFTAAACASLPLAALAVGWRHRDHLWYRRFARTARAFGVASVPCFVPFLVSFVVLRLSRGAQLAIVPTGLVERLMVVLDIAILLVFALWANTAARGRHVAGS
jgi:hypothetical protein